MSWPQTRKSPAGTGPIRNNLEPRHCNPFSRFVDAAEAVTGRPVRNGRLPCPSCGPESRSYKLSIGEGDDGRVLIRCFAECSASEICAAVGLRLADLFAKDPAWRPDPTRPRINRELREQLSLDRWVGHICLYDLFHDRPVKGRDLDCAAGAFNRLRRYSPRFFDEAVRVHRLEVEA